MRNRKLESLRIKDPPSGPVAGSETRIENQVIKKRIHNLNFIIPHFAKATRGEHNLVKPNGFTLMETMVVLALFSVLAILVTYAVVFSVRGTRKSEVTYNLREQLDTAIEVVERQLRNARGVTSECDDTPWTGARIDYVNQEGFGAYFYCTGSNIASGSADLGINVNLVGAGVSVNPCLFTCYQSGDIGIPEEVTLSVTAQDVNAAGPEAVTVDMETKILLRNH